MLDFILNYLLSTIALVVGIIADFIAILDFTKKQKKNHSISIIIIIISSLTILVSVVHLVVQSKASNENGTEPSSDVESNGVNINGNGNMNVNGDGNIIAYGDNNSFTVDSTGVQNVTVSSVTIDTENCSMKINEEKIFSAKVLYSDNSIGNSVIWSSSNENVLQISDNGQAKAVGAGTAKITAQASKNNTAQNATCVVEVIAPPSGYYISLSTYKASQIEAVHIHVNPYESDYKNIIIVGVSPSGKEYKLPSTDNGFTFDESGTWTISAIIENDAGVYQPNKAEDYVYLEVVTSLLDEVYNSFLE